MKRPPEIVVAALVSALVAAGVAVLLAPRRGESPVPRVASAPGPAPDFSGFFLSLDQCLRNPEAWRNTTANPANKVLGCISALAPCEPGQSGELLPADAAAGAGCAGLTQADQGISALGRPCQAGADGCDLRVKITGRLECAPGLKKCGSPTVLVEAQVLERDAVLRSQAYRVPAYAEKRFVLTQRLPKGQGGGACEGGWTVRRFNFAATETADAVLAVKTPNGSVLLAPGSYDCEISAPAYRVTAHQAALFELTKRALLVLGSSERSPDAPTASQTTSRGFGHFVLKEHAAVALFHYCEHQPEEARLKTSALGAPAGRFPESYAELSCVVH